MCSGQGTTNTGGEQKERREGGTRPRANQQRFSLSFFVRTGHFLIFRDQYGCWWKFKASRNLVQASRKTLTPHTILVQATQRGGNFLESFLSEVSDYYASFH